MSDSGKSIYSREVQPSNTLPLFAVVARGEIVANVFRLEDNLTSVSAVQSWKAPLSIVVTLSGITILCIAVFANAAVPIVFIALPLNTTLVRLLQFSNTLEPSVVTVAGISTPEIAVALKADEPILVSEPLSANVTLAKL